MRLTYTMIKDEYLRNIGQSNSPSDAIIASFNQNLGQRYQLILAKLQAYVTQKPVTMATAVGTQYYPYPPGLVSIDDVVVTIGSVQYPLTTIYAQHQWDVINAIQIQPTAIPQFLFPRRDDFGIWPIPQGIYTVTFYYYLRDRNLTIADYTTGTVTVTNGDATITGTNTVWTAAMVGRWFTVTDPTGIGQGYWYRIASFTNATSMELDRTYVSTTQSGLTYRIGESPEIPEEGHELLIDGALADFYAGLRNDNETATWYNNKFWTGDGNNPNRDEGNSDLIAAGLIGLATRYSGRDSKRVIQRKPRGWPPAYQIWATQLS